MKKLILYSTLGCHLCEQAKQLITPLLEDNDQLDEVDIIESDQLMKLYGVRIPVIVRCDNNNEIAWPFDRAQCLKFLDL